MPSHLFISVPHPSERQDQAASKAIRSWVTRVQVERRRGLACKGEPLGGCDQEFDDTSVSHFPSSTDFSAENAHPTAAAKAVGQSAWNFMLVNDTGQLTRDARRQVQAHVARRQHQHRRELEQLERPDETEHSSNDDVPPPMTSASTPYTAYSSPTNSPCPSLDDPVNVLDCYAKQLNTSVPIIWSRYLWQEQEHGRAFREQYQQYQGWDRKWLHSLILGNQALLATTVLFTGSHIRFSQGDTIMDPVILRLRSLSHEYVQAALDNEDDCCSDSTILAVVKLALFEALFGIRQAVRIHMVAVAQMVRLRHGLQNLGMHGYVAHLILWFDANLSSITKSPRYLDQEISMAPSFRSANADEDTFRLGVEPVS